MKNNQFKKLIRTNIEDMCLHNNLICIYVDHSNNDRIFYIYDGNYKIKGTISLYLNNTGFHMKASKDIEKVVNLNNYELDSKHSYMKFDLAVQFISDFMGLITKRTKNRV